MAKDILSIEIRDTAIHWFTGQVGFRTSAINDSGVLSLVGNYRDLEGLRKVLSHIAEQADLSQIDCLVSIPVSRASYRVVRVPFADRKKIRQMLPLELEPSLPFSVDEAVICFQSFTRNGRTSVLAASALKEDIQPIIDTLGEFSIEPSIITLAGVATATQLAEGDPDRTIALLEGNESGYGLFLLANGTIAAVRPIRSPAVAKDSLPWISGEIRRTLNLFRMILPDLGPVEKLVISSNRHSDSFLTDLSKALSLETFPIFFEEESSALNGLLGSNHQSPDALLLSFKPVQAQRGLILYKGTYPLRKFIHKNRTHLIRVSAMTSFLIVVLFAHLWVGIHRMETDIRHLDREMANLLTSTFPDVKRVVDPIHQMKGKVKALQDQSGLGSWNPSNLKMIDILNDISRRIPPSIDIEVGQFVASASMLQLSGTTNTFQSVNELKDHLGSLSFADTITIISANMDNKSGKVRFKLSIQLTGTQAT